MRVIRQADVRIFTEKVTPFLCQHEASNNLIFGILYAIEQGVYENPYMGYVEAENELVGVALRTPPHGVLLSYMADDAAIPCLIDSLADVYNSLPSIMGSQDAATQFAETWKQAHHLHMTQGCYQLTQVSMPENVPGEYRRPTGADLEMIVDWQEAMNREALGESMARETLRARVASRINPDDKRQGYRIWWDAGKPVSMVLATGPTPNGMRITAVYTPPEYRKRGYASAVTAAVSQEILDSGRKFCFLFTDMGNPTSNHIYQMIGYEQIDVKYLYEFEEQ